MLKKPYAAITLLVAWANLAIDFLQKPNMVLNHELNAALLWDFYSIGLSLEICSELKIILITNTVSTLSQSAIFPEEK